MTAPTKVQSTAWSVASNRQQTISSPTIGNLMVTFVNSFFSASTLTDSSGNTHTLYGSHADSNGNFCHIFTSPITHTAATVTISDSSHNCNIQINEITGFDSGSPTDGAFEFGTFSGSSGGTLTATAVTTTFADDLILSAAFDQNSAALSVNTGTLIAFLNTDSGSDTCISQQHTVSVTGSYAEKFNVPTSASETAVICVIAIKGISSGPTVALIGQSSAFSAGTLAPSNSIACTGEAATVTAGTVAPSTSLALIGQAASSVAGTLTPSISLSLLGSGATFAAGTLSPVMALALNGQGVTSTPGALTAALSLPLNGTSAAFTPGTVTASNGNVTVALTGAQALFTAGSVTSSGGTAVDLHYVGFLVNVGKIGERE